MTLRHVLLIAIVLLAIYLLSLLWRLVRKPKAVPVALDVIERAAAEPVEPEFSSAFDRSLASARSREPLRDMVRSGPSTEAGLPVAQAHEIALQALQASVRALERRCHALETVVDGLQDRVRADEVVRQSSPLYAEAVALARRGYDAEAIAERCGISVAEAQLVSSLSSRPTERGGEND